jgi:hypothetical protein
MSFKITGNFKITSDNGVVLFDSGSSVSTNSLVSQNNLETSDNVSADRDFIEDHPKYVYYKLPNTKLGTYKDIETSPKGDDYFINFNNINGVTTASMDDIEYKKVYYKKSDNNKGGWRKTKKRRNKRY